VLLVAGQDQLGQDRFFGREVGVQRGGLDGCLGGDVPDRGPWNPCSANSPSPASRIRPRVLSAARRGGRAGTPGRTLRTRGEDHPGRVRSLILGCAFASAEGMSRGALLTRVRSLVPAAALNRMAWKLLYGPGTPVGRAARLPRSRGLPTTGGTLCRCSRRSLRPRRRGPWWAAWCCAGAVPPRPRTRTGREAATSRSGGRGSRPGRRPGPGMPGRRGGPRAESGHAGRWPGQRGRSRCARARLGAPGEDSRRAACRTRAILT
jgi:hypothetical protein